LDRNCKWHKLNHLFEPLDAPRQSESTSGWGALYSERHASLDMVETVYIENQRRRTQSHKEHLSSCAQNIKGILLDLAKSGKIKHLHITDCWLGALDEFTPYSDYHGIGKTFIEPISQLKSLESLSVRYSEAVAKKGDYPLAKVNISKLAASCPQLRELYFGAGYYPTMDEGAPSLATLRKLTLNGAPNAMLSIVDPAEVTRVVSNCPKLEELHLIGLVCITGKIFAPTEPPLKRLTTLNLDQSDKVRDEDIQDLMGRMQSLRLVTFPNGKALSKDHRIIEVEENG